MNQQYLISPIKYPEGMVGVFSSEGPSNEDLEVEDIIEDKPVKKSDIKKVTANLYGNNEKVDLKTELKMHNERMCKALDMNNV